MGGFLSDYRLFWREFRQTFHTTGRGAQRSQSLPGIGPICRHAGDRPRRILEVGPGTGAVTDAIIERLHPADQLDLVDAQ